MNSRAYGPSSVAKAAAPFSESCTVSSGSTLRRTIDGSPMCQETSVVRERSWFALTSCWWNSRTSFQCQTCTLAGGSSPGARRSGMTLASRGATPKNNVAPSSDHVGVRYAATRSPAGNDRSFEKSYTCFLAAAPTPFHANTAYAVSAKALSALLRMAARSSECARHVRPV
jgi:hypothetical protein